MKIEHDLLYMDCPCGSGKKFKFCCLEKVRKMLPAEPDKGDIVTAIRKEMCCQAEGKHGNPYDNPEAVHLMFSGVRARNCGKFDEALDLFERARKKNPKVYTAWNNEAQTHWLIGNLELAIETQKKGLKYAAKYDAYGWAQLAEFHYFLTRNTEAHAYCEKALSILPVSVDATAKVCAALALLKRHEDIIAYAQKSGFDDAFVVKSYVATAEQNLEDRKRKQRPPLPYDKNPYFSLHFYEAGPLEGHVFTSPRAEYENIACDMVSFLLEERYISNADALEALAYFSGERAEALKAVIRVAKERKLARGYKAGTIGGELAVQRALFKNGLPPVLLDMLGADPIGEEPEAKLTDQMRKVLYKIQEAPYGTKAWEKAFASLAKLSVEKPKSKLIQKCYAEELMRAERFEEAIAVLEKLLEFYPTFYDVYSLVIDAATRLKQYDVAASYIQAMRIPLKMNTFSYLNYQEALKGYYEAIGDKEGEAVAKKYHEFGKDFLEEFVEQLNDSLTDEDLEDLDFDDEDDDDEDFDDEELLNSLLAKLK